MLGIKQLSDPNTEQGTCAQEGDPNTGVILFYNYFIVVVFLFILIYDFHNSSWTCLWLPRVTYKAERESEVQACLCNCSKTELQQCLLPLSKLHRMKGLNVPKMFLY